MASNMSTFLVFFLAVELAVSGVYSRIQPIFPEASFRDGGNPNLRNAEKCGYYGLKNGQVITIQSSNFNKLTANYEQCDWKFLGHRCALKTSCPCFDVPYTGECASDYLKISDTTSFAHTFCGETQPLGVFNSTSNTLNFSYRSDGRDVSNGFICYVSCTGKGQRDPPALRTSRVTCRV